MLTLTNARIFDGTGMAPHRRSVTIDGDRIAAVGEGAPLSGEVIDVAGMTVAPGLICCHLHADNFKGGRTDPLGAEWPPGMLMAIGVRTCRVLLETGFTGFVGAACSNDIDAQLKMAIAEGIVPGPRIRPCGHHIGTTADANDGMIGKWWQELAHPGTDLFADGPDAIRRLVRLEIRNGVEIVKVFFSSGHGVTGPTARNMARDEIEALVQAAHERGAKVRAHVCHKELILEAIELGIEVIDHGDEVDEACIEAMATAGTFWVPSLAFLEAAQRINYPDPGDAMARARASVRRMLPLAQKAGVRMLLGDDYGGGRMLRHDVGAYAGELAMYGAVDGLSGADVLGWATRNAGQLLVDPPDRVGVIEKGALADLIVVDGDPAADLTLLQRPDETLRAVIRDGRFVIDRLPRAARAGGARQAELAAGG